MFTDIVGYTAMMQHSEQEALSAVKRHQELLEGCVLHHKGKVLQYYGDGSLSIFSSAVQAVECAMQLQQQYQLPPKVPLRIGIHIGDILFEDEKVFGDGVNLASRIESSAKEGEIYISEDVWRNIKNKEGFAVEYLGKKSFKNIEEPIRIYKLKGLEVPEKSKKNTWEAVKFRQIGLYGIVFMLFVLAGYFLLNQNNSGSSKAGIDQKALALLPLVNISDEENGYLVNSVKNEIAYYLRQIPDLKVYAGMDVERLVARKLTMKEIGKTLGVMYVLEGTIWKEGNRFQLKLFLTDVNSGETLWQESYDKEFNLLMDVVSSVAKDLAVSLQIHLTSDEVTRMSTFPTVSPEAYDLNLRAWQLWQKSLTSSEHHRDSLLEVSRALALKALEYDSNFIGAQELILNYELIRGKYDTAKFIADHLISEHPGRAEGYKVKAGIQYMEGDYDRSFETYQKALEIDPKNSYAHLQLGRLYCYIKNDYINGITHLIKSVELPPEYGLQTDFYYISEAYMSIGDYQKAMYWARRQFDYEANCNSAWNIIRVFTRQGTEERSLSFMDSICRNQLCENCDPMYYLIYSLQGNTEKAAQYSNIDSTWGFFRQNEAHLSIQAGNTGKGQKILHELIKEIEDPATLKARGLYDWQFALAETYSILGEKKKAIKWLKECEKRGFWHGNHDAMMVFPFFENIRDDPEFIAIYQRVQKEKAEIRTKVKELDEKGVLAL